MSLWYDSFVWRRSLHLSKFKMSYVSELGESVQIDVLKGISSKSRYMKYRNMLGHYQKVQSSNECVFPGLWS